MRYELAIKLCGQAALATSDTMPRHIWLDEVSLIALRNGVDAASLEAHRPRMNRAYTAGEAVWMMLEELLLVAKQRKLIAREESDRNVIRNAWRRAR